MRILLLPNSLKGSLSARQTARVLESVLSPRHCIKSFPLSDGGDGFIDFFKALHPSARLIHLRAKNAFLKERNTSYLWLEKEKTAVIETARICGLATAKKEELNVLKASSFGIGQAMAHALRQGAKKIYIGLGGVACNDAGAGIARALGALFWDRKNQPLADGAKPLLQLARIETEAAKRLLRGVKIYAVADVVNPMLGPQGSARVFGPQKGATPAQVRTLEKALRVYARAVKNTTHRDIAHTPGTAAAGALCAGLYGLLGAKIVFGADFIRQHLPLERWTQWAELVITAEGKLDAQTFFGKAPLAVLNCAAKNKKPVLFICGSYDEKSLRKLPHGLRLSVLSLVDFAPHLSDCIKNPTRYLRRALKRF